MTREPVEVGEPASKNAFGTFGGVFTPSILTILGVIMYMRSGFVTGQAGIWAAVLILLLSTSITFLTSLSISAISTNTRVKGGGAYFLISRSLGPEFGGAIGLTLFLAQALSVPFFILGFVEALMVSFPGLAEWFVPIGMATAAVLFVVTHVGASWAIKAQYVILGTLVLSVVALLGGAIAHFEVATFQANWSPAYRESGINFWVVFAIFFPAVTGIMAGVNMSGDLREPSRSIPSGTLAAVAVGGLIYLAQIVLTGGAQSRDRLVDAPYGSLLEQALFGFDFLIVAGVFAATISSALGSLMGAPRVLQALARDNIFPALKPFAFGTLKGDEPRRGLWLTFGLTLGVLWLAGGGGDALNAVAAVLSMFFLVTYGMTNMAAFLESFSGNPSFRPRFRFFHWSTGLAGAAGCFTVAFLIDAVAAVGAVLVTLVTFFYVRRQALTTSFGDARRGFTYNRVRTNLIKLAGQTPHPKNWRPTTLVLSGNPMSRQTLSAYASWLAGRRGIVTLAEIIVGRFEHLAQTRREALDRLQRYIDDNGVNAFPEVIVSESLDDGMSHLIQCHSIGPIKPNLLILGWSRQGRAASFNTLLRMAGDLGVSQVIVNDRGLPKGQNRRIDIWWRGERNGSLMLILAYLLTANWAWNQARIRILRISSPDENPDKSRRDLLELASAARISVTTLIVEPLATVQLTIKTHSSDASVVLLGFQTPSAEDDEAFQARYDALLEALPTTLLIWSNGEADLLA